MAYKRNLAAFLVENFSKSNRGRMVTPQEDQGLPLPLEGPDPQFGRSGKSPIRSHSLHDSNQVMEVETILLEDLIKPLMLLTKFFLPFRIVLRYDPIAKCVVARKGSFIRKIFWILLELIVLYRLGIRVIARPMEGEGNNASLSNSTLEIGAYITFILYNLTCFLFCWCGGTTCCDIFNHTLQLAEAFHVKDRTPPRIRIMRYGVHASWIFSAAYVIMTMGLYMGQIFLLVEKLESDIDMKAQSNSSKALKVKFDATEIHSGNSDDHILLQLISTFGSFASIYSWMLQYLQFGLWAMFFRQLIIMFYWRIGAKREQGEGLLFPQEIRTFNRIVSIMDEYNGINGFVNLLGAVVVVSYVTTTVKHVFSNFLNIFQMGAGLHLLLSYVPLVMAAVLAAEVQRVAGSFAGILKDEYGRFSKTVGDPAESLCGISMVHYDLATDNIGLKGLGFYTVSYHFITTILGVIVTYSIMVAQLFPRDNSVEEP